MKIIKADYRYLTNLPIKTRLSIMFVITISLLIILWSLGVYEGGPTHIWHHTNTFSSLQGAPGEAVFFNYTVQTEGGRIVYHAEFGDIDCEWPWDVNPSKISVNPGETQVLSFRIEIPWDAEIGESISMSFYLYTWETLHGIDFGGYGKDSKTLTLTVIEEWGTNEETVDWERIKELSDSQISIPDVVYFVISLYLILFIQAIFFFMIPAMRKHKKRGNEVTNNK